MTIQAFKKLIRGYYAAHKRDLPWRKNINPYRILVSEVMLQQTQVNRVEIKYQEFLKKFPTTTSLARSSVTDVLMVWQGLGYNRRALMLKRAAEIITKEHNGKIPTDILALVKLPGIGPGTAGALSAYAFNIPVPFIETNIRRIFIHHFFSDRTDVHDNEIMPLVAKSLDMENPREWYWALMDYGSYLSKTVTNPNRNSKHYTKQSKFEGSNRMLRGKIIKKLVVSPSTIEKLSHEFEQPGLKIREVVDQLAKEGFVIEEKRIIRIK